MKIFSFMLGIALLLCACEGQQQPDFSGIAGKYACSGLERGMRAGAGNLTIDEQGVMTFTDYYQTMQASSPLEQINDTEFRVLKPIIFDFVKHYPNGDLTLTLHGGVPITHAEGGYIECFPISSP